ncbi:hypothetical protein V8F06_014529 [Rhypophila decipiens]
MVMDSPGDSRLFTLPREIRDDIYKRILVVTPALYIFQESGQKIELFAPDRPANRGWLSLLYVSRKIHNEAAAVLYRSHQFILVDTTAAQVKLLESFLDCIGVNASHISRICINFPAAEDMGVRDQEGKAVLREDGLRSLKLLQERCTNLVTLETHLHSDNSKGLTTASYDSSNSEDVREVLSQINAYLNAIPSLHNVLVRVYSGPLHSLVVSWMQEFGWDVSRGR